MKTMLLGLVLAAISLAHAKSNIQSGEYLYFKMYIHGLPAADAEMRICENGGNEVLLQWDVATRSFYKWFYRVENCYKTVLNKNTHQLRQVHKNVAEKDVEHDLTISYDFENLTARTNLDTTWKVLPQTQSVMGMLYHLRRRDPQPGDSLRYVLDLEREPWQLTGRVEPCNENLNALYESNRCVQLTLSPIDTLQKMPWEPDILTYYMAQPETQLFIYLSPPPKNLPVFIRFDNGNKCVDFNLEIFSWSGRCH